MVRNKDLEVPFASADYVLRKDMKDGESHDYIQNKGKIQEHETASS